jgi:protein-L-isoaspartate O-methyltransferase
MANQHESSTPLREALSRRLARRSAATGQIQLPAVPSMIDDYVTMCGNVFAEIGRSFTEAELAHLKEALQSQLTEAFTKSPRSTIVVSYSAGIASLLNYEINIEWWTLEKAYENWISSRKPPLFGTEPDARVWALSTESMATADPSTHAILDIGAGTGRNALALARRGHPVDAVELTPKFAESIEADAARESLPVRVIHGDVFSSTSELRRDYRLILLSEVVSDFRSVQQVRGLFELAAHCLTPGGQLVFNAFLAKPDYSPDDAARELGQQCYTSIFTGPEISTAAAGLPLSLVSDDSVYGYEKAHLPSTAWPPTSWYEEWVSGQDVFDVPREQSPIEMRWLVYRKSPAA